MDLNRTSIEPGIVGTAIEGTIRLQSDFEVRYYSSLFKFYIHHFDIFFWQLSRDPRTACTWQSFAVDHQLMIDSFAAAFFKMGLLGQANNHKVSNRWYFILATNHASHRWLIAVQSSLNLRLSMIKFSSLLANSSKTLTNRWVMIFHIALATTHTTGNLVW